MAYNALMAVAAAVLFLAMAALLLQSALELVAGFGLSLGATFDRLFFFARQ